MVLAGEQTWTSSNRLLWSLHLTSTAGPNSRLSRFQRRDLWELMGGLWHSDPRLGRSPAGRANPARYLVFDELQHRCALARAQSRQQQSGEYPDPRLLLHGL